MELDEDSSEDTSCKEKAIHKLIRSKISKPKRKLLKLLRDLENDGIDALDLKELTQTFLASEDKEINRELQDALRMLKTSSKSVEIGMLLNDIEKENYRLNQIFYRLGETEPNDLKFTLQRLKQEELITQELFEKLLERPYAVLEVLKNDSVKKGDGVTMFLPSSPEEMLDKL